MQPARTKTAAASRAAAQSVVIMMGSFGRDAGYGQCPVTLFGGSASLNFDDSIMTAPTYAAVARTLRFCRLSFRFAEESVGIEVLP